MPSVWVTEAVGVRIMSGGHEVQALTTPFLAQYEVNFTGGQGPAFQEGTTAVRIVADSNCWVTFDGSAPVANTSLRVGSEKEEVIGIGGDATSQSLRVITRT